MGLPIKRLNNSHKINQNIILLIILILVCFQTKISTAESPQPTGPDETANVVFDSIFNKCVALLYSYPDSARKIIFESKSHLLPEDTLSLIRLYNLAGATYSIQASYGDAIAYYTKGLNLAMKTKEEKRIADICNNLGAAYLKLGNHKDALELFHKALDIYERIGIEKELGTTHNNIGLLYMEIVNFDKALHYFQLANKKNIVSDTVNIAARLTNIGSLYLEKGDYDSSFRYLEKSIKLHKSSGSIYGLSVALKVKANAFEELGDYKKAISNYRQSKNNAQLVNHHYQIADADLGLAGVYCKLNNIDQALAHADSALLIAGRLNNIKLKKDTYAVYANIFEETGNSRKALENYRKSVTLRDELINQNKLHQIYNLEIDKMSKDAEIQQLEIQRQELLLSKKNNIIIFIVVAFVLTLAGIYLLYINFNHRRKANLQETILSLTEKKSRAAAEAEIQERKRIGQELHDGLGQMLSVARLNISVLQQKRILSDTRKKELIGTALHSVDEAFYELRNISHNLAPSVLSVKGLATALRELVDQVNQSKHIKIQLEIYGINGSMDDIVENTLYRASQELISNTIKHSKASRFFMQVVKSEKEITMMVEDNGDGFDLENTLIRPGGGLSNIRSRVENLGGNIFVDSMKNRGTIVSVMVPLKKPEYAGKTNKSIDH